MRRVTLAAAVLAMLGVGMAYDPENAVADDLEVTMQVLGDYEDVERLLASVQRALRESGSARAKPSRKLSPPEVPTGAALNDIDEHVAIFKLDDRLEGELEDEN